LVPQLREIEVRINNRSLEKCQVHPTSKGAKPLFLVNQTERGGLLCCEECSRGCRNRVPIEKIAETVVGEGLTIRQYSKLLAERLESLENIKNNISGYEQEFRSAHGQQMGKHRKYYHEILEII
jgi:hypothetical protein